jgi:hypothetical protein
MLEPIESFFISLFLVSSCGLLFIVFKKIPILSSLEIKEKKEGLKERIKNRISQMIFNQRIYFEKLAEKFLMKARILALKTDYKTWQWLKKLRERKNKREILAKDYWKIIKEKIKEKTKKDAPV